MRWHRRALADRSGEAPTDLTTRIGSVTLPNPVMTASGTAGHGAELAPYLDLAGAGRGRREVAGRLPVGGQPGAPPAPDDRRACSTPSGSRARASRPGCSDDLPPLLRTGARVVASIWGRSVESTGPRPTCSPSHRATWWRSR